jgi:hypothetical protein
MQATCLTLDHRWHIKKEEGEKKGIILKLTCHKVDFPTYVQHYLQAKSCSV